MQHFVRKDNFNIFRLPVGWQYLVNYVPGGSLDPQFFATYDDLVTQCLGSGAYCVIDIHNYARWNGKIIGQGGPSDQQFISLWTQLAKHYATQQKIIFGIMNEPHDLDMTSWARTAQAAIKAIRIAGATSQLILLPGDDWSAASSFVQDSAPAMATVIDADGTTTKLIYDIHQYFDGKDGNGGGNEAICTTDHVSDGFSPLADYLRSYGRQALLSETGGGNTSSCLQYICSALDFLNANSDVFLGWVGWAAGSFDDSYLANESPQGDTDTSLIRMCLALKFNP